LKFIEGLKQAKDKTGRPIASHFLTLPNKEQVPDYFVHVKLPIALDTIEEKLHSGAYANLAQVESDCKRLVNNAKAYNDKKSPIYEDAERLRKTASNWMVKHNPAYRDGNYVAVATPIPGEENPTPGKPIPRIVSTPRPVHTPTISETVDRPRRAAAAAQFTPTQATPVPSKLRQSASLAPEDHGSPDFAGKTFQQAQEQIIRELIEHEDGGLQIFAPFQNLPSRSLKDYYQLIKDPMSLAAVYKRVRGVVGREPPTGHTLFKSWDVFEDAVSLIWKNARIYNEDGSDIYNLSLEFEELFKNKLQEAKAKVNEPTQPKLKLNLSNAAPVPKQQLKLKLRQSPASDPNTPAAHNAATPGVIVDGDALVRQQRHVLDSMASRRTSRASPIVKPATPSASTNPFSGPRGGSATVAPLSAAQTRTAGSPPALNGVKQDVQSPALSAIRPATTAPDSQAARLGVPSQTQHPVMAPPTLHRMASGSPHPNGFTQPNGVYATPQAQTYYAAPAVPRVDSFRKVPLKNIDEALIPKITLNTHPALNLAKPWSVSVHASKQKNDPQCHHCRLGNTLVHPDHAPSTHCTDNPPVPPVRYGQWQSHPRSQPRTRHCWYQR